LTLGFGIEELRDAAHGPRIGIDGLVAPALEFERPEVAGVEAVEAVSLAGFHAKLLINQPGMGHREHKRCRFTAAS